MADAFPTVPMGSLVDAAASLLRFYPALLVKKKGHFVGIVTKADLLKTV